MNKWKVYIAAAFICIFIQGCKNSNLKYSIPVNAYDVGEIENDKDGIFQKSFKHKVNYPDIGFLDSLKIELKAQNITECAENAEKWINVTKKSGDNFIPTKQYLVKLHSKDKKLFVVVLLQYISSETSDLKKVDWNYKKQIVSIVEYDLSSYSSNKLNQFYNIQKCD